MPRMSSTNRRQFSRSLSVKEEFQAEKKCVNCGFNLAMDERIDGVMAASVRVYATHSRGDLSQLPIKHEFQLERVELKHFLRAYQRMQFNKKHSASLHGRACFMTDRYSPYYPSDDLKKVQGYHATNCVKILIIHSRVRIRGA